MMAESNSAGQFVKSLEEKGFRSSGNIRIRARDRDREIVVWDKVDFLALTFTAGPVRYGSIASVVFSEDGSTKTIWLNTRAERV